jgi:hypothetical protein
MSNRPPRVDRRMKLADEWEGCTQPERPPDNNSVYHTYCADCMRVVAFHLEVPGHPWYEHRERIFAELAEVGIELPDIRPTRSKS